MSYMKCPVCGLVQGEGEGGWEDQPCDCIGELVEVEVPICLADLDRLDEIKKKKSELEKEEKKLAPKIKEFLVNNQINTLKYGKHNLVITYQDRSTMDEDKMVNLIKKVMSPNEIIETNAIKEASNPEAVKNLVREGRLTMEQLSTCKIPNIIPVFNVNPKPKKELSEKTTPNPFGGMF